VYPDIPKLLEFALSSVPGICRFRRSLERMVGTPLSEHARIADQSAVAALLPSRPGCPVPTAGLASQRLAWTMIEAAATKS